MEDLTISEVARRSGLRPSAIRYYESVNVLPTPRRVSGHRRYDSSILERLAFIQLARRVGFSVAELQTLLQDEHKQDTPPVSERWRVLAQQKLSEVNALIMRGHSIKNLLEQGLRCGCQNIEDCIDCILQTTPCHQAETGQNSY